MSSSTMKGICGHKSLNDFGKWNGELEFLTRIILYIVILAILMMVIILILKLLGASDEDYYEVESPEVTETQPLMAQKVFGSPYGTGEDGLESGTFSSSEELYDGKLCVICYDTTRDCFFTPCGHCATCRNCGQRIMDEESKACPICRRLIHKMRKLTIP